MPPATRPTVAVSQHVGQYTRDVLRYAQPNMRFVTGQIEDLASAGIPDCSQDLVISNCVVGMVGTPVSEDLHPCTCASARSCVAPCGVPHNSRAWHVFYSTPSAPALSCKCVCLYLECFLPHTLQVNLSPNKAAVMREAWRVLAPGGEMHFSDVYTDRRLPREVRLLRCEACMRHVVKGGAQGGETGVSEA